METNYGFGYDFQDVVDSSNSRVIQENDPLPRIVRIPKQQRRRRKTVATTRKNRPFKNVVSMSLECCEKQTCLESYGREIIQNIRRMYDRMLYEAQNSYLISLIDITPRQTGKPSLIRYSIRDRSGLGKMSVCKTAFLKIFGIGIKRIRILISKLQPYTGQIEEDQRQKLSRNQRRLPLALKAEVVSHIQGYDRELSHYGRAKNKDKEFLAPNLSLAQLWRDFIELKQLLPGEKRPISFSTFRSIFKKFNLSFRKPKVDTCSRCDSYEVIKKYSHDKSEVEEVRAVKRAHLRSAQERYDSSNYDMRVLVKRTANDNGVKWAKPPVWRR